MTKSEFYNQICDLPNKFKNKDLKTYLLSLLLLVYNRKDRSMNADILLDMLRSAFFEDPAEFDNEWLKKNTPPVLGPENNGFYFTVEVIQFQIAELHKMQDKQLKNEYKYFGISSETKNPWYNFDPFTNLECGTNGLLQQPIDDHSEFIAEWQIIGLLLEIGRVYE